MNYLHGKNIHIVRIEQKLLAHAERLYGNDRRLANLLPLESLMREAGRIAYDRGHADGVSLTYDNLPPDRAYAWSIPLESIRLSFKAAAQELLLEFDCMPNGELIASSTLALPYSRLRAELRVYQECIVENYFGETRLRVFAQQDGKRRMEHERVTRALFGNCIDGVPTDNGSVVFCPNTQRNVVSVIGLLFPKGPLGSLLKQDEDVPPPTRPGLKYEDGYAVFDSKSLHGPC